MAEVKSNVWAAHAERYKRVAAKPMRGAPVPPPQRKITKALKQAESPSPREVVTKPVVKKHKSNKEFFMTGAVRRMSHRTKRQRATQKQLTFLYSLRDQAIAIGLNVSWMESKPSNYTKGSASKAIDMLMDKLGLKKPLRTMRDIASPDAIATAPKAW